MTERIMVETRIVIAPDERPGILLQLSEGWTVIPQPDAAREIAQNLLDLADELETMIQ